MRYFSYGARLAGECMASLIVDWEWEVKLHSMARDITEERVHFYV
jgi:hypothetical protein